MPSMRLFWAFIEAWDVRDGCGELYEKVAGGDAGLLSIADESVMPDSRMTHWPEHQICSLIAWLTALSHKASWVFIRDGITGLSIIMSFLLSGIAWFCSYSSPRTFPLATENIIPSAGRAPRKLDRARTPESKVRVRSRSLDPIDSIGWLLPITVGPILPAEGIRAEI